MNNNNNLLEANQSAVPDSARVVKSGKTIKNELNDIVKEQRSKFKETSRVYQLAASKIEIKKYLNNLTDEELIEVRRKIFRPKSYNDAGKLLIGVVLASIAKEFLDYFLFPEKHEEINTGSLWFNIIFFGGFLFIGVLLLIIAYYKQQTLFESFNDNFDECKLELIDEILKEREEEYISKLNNSSNSTSNSQTP